MTHNKRRAVVIIQKLTIHFEIIFQTSILAAQRSVLRRSVVLVVHSVRQE